MDRAKSKRAPESACMDTVCTDRASSVHIRSRFDASPPAAHVRVDRGQQACDRTWAEHCVLKRLLKSHDGNSALGREEPHMVARVCMQGRHTREGPHMVARVCMEGRPRREGPHMVARVCMQGRHTREGPHKRVRRTESQQSAQALSAYRYILPVHVCVAEHDKRASVGSCPVGLF
eukprot:364649-Chlamydomonas_euryale.AAC.4